MIGLGGFEKILIVVIMAMREATVSSVMDIAVAWIDSFEAEAIGSRESMMSGWFKEIIIIKKMRRGEKCFILLELLRSLLRLLSFP